jgi:hypothetical protein
VFFCVVVFFLVLLCVLVLGLGGLLLFFFVLFWLFVVLGCFVFGCDLARGAGWGGWVAYLAMKNWSRLAEAGSKNTPRSPLRTAISPPL